MIKIARRLEKYHLAWLEDMLPWYLTGQYRGAEARHHGSDCHRGGHVPGGVI